MRSKIYCWLVGASDEKPHSLMSKAFLGLYKSFVYFILLPFGKTSFTSKNKSIPQESNYIPLQPSDWNNIKELR